MTNPKTIIPLEGFSTFYGFQDSDCMSGSPWIVLMVQMRECSVNDVQLTRVPRPFESNFSKICLEFN